METEENFVIIFDWIELTLLLWSKNENFFWGFIIIFMKSILCEKLRFMVGI